MWAPPPDTACNAKAVVTRSPVELASAKVPRAGHGCAGGSCPLIAGQRTYRDCPRLPRRAVASSAATSSDLSKDSLHTQITSVLPVLCAYAQQVSGLKSGSMPGR